MEIHNPPQSEVKETTVVGSIKLLETPYRVKTPVFEEVVVKVPKFVEEIVTVPVGIIETVDELVSKGVERILNKLELVVGARLDAAIDQRIREIKYPKLVEQVEITVKSVEVLQPLFKEVEVIRPILKDVEVINPVVRNVEVVNAVIADQTVINAVITDQKVTNAIIKDVEVERAVIREKVVDVIHPRYLDLKGNEVS